MEPWFYERRFLRPAFARQWYLGVLRRLSSAERLPSTSAAPAAPVRETTADVLVAGGGPAGVAAAAAAARRGMSVIVATRAAAGGSLPLDAATRARVARDLSELHRSGATILERALVAGWYGEEGRFAVLSADGPRSIRADRCVIATGAYDRPLLLPGADLPGVMGLRGFQMLAAEGALRGRSVGAVGGAVELERVEATVAAFRLDLRWTLGPSDPPVARIVGRRRAGGLETADGVRRRADALVIATTQPTYELQIHLGGTARSEGLPRVIRAEPPAGAGALVVGEAAGWSTIEGIGERAAAAVDAWFAGDGPETHEASPADGPRVVDAPDAVICVCEDVRRRDLDLAVREGFTDVDLVKRRSGATTGACQGKLCLCLIAEAFEDRGLAATVPTVRPPIRPVTIAQLAGRP